VLFIKKWAKDLTNMRFGKLTVVERAEDYIAPMGHKSVCWLCQCDCGNTVITRGSRLKNGHTKSCGCLAANNLISNLNNRDYSHLNKGYVIHGLHGTRIYNIWRGMKERCLVPTASNYHRYGGRGITICDEWKDNIVNFYNWSMENGYSDNLSIDRIDNDKGYEPSNCRWVTNSCQQRNKRNNHYLIFNNERSTISEFSKKTGIHQKCIRRRLSKGFTPNEIYKELRA
jgi:hypothetical protein